MTALGALQADLEKLCIPTSSQKLDNALGNGIRLGTVTEFVGSSGVGKSQFCLQAVLNTILPAPIGMIDGEAVYISTKRNFHPLRVNHLVETFVFSWEAAAAQSKNRSIDFKTKFTKQTALEHIHHKLVQNVSELISIVYHLRLFAVKKRNVTLMSLSTTCF